MTHDGVQRPEVAIAWELRGAWASGRPVRLTLSERCVLRTVIGRVERVAATGAFAVVDGWHVPLEDVMAVGKPTVQDRDEYAAGAPARAELAREQEGGFGG